MLEASRRQMLERLPESALVLDVGGWAKPLSRADWVLDLMPYETRGLYGGGPADGEIERFSVATWVQADICARSPWPFGDDQFDFAVCSHTLEDVRDPVWVCEELQRVARAGYIEVPSRLQEQTPGVQGPWVGWGHHRWLCEVDQAAGSIEFVFKHHILHGRPDMQLPYEAYASLGAEQRVGTLWWKESFRCAERIFVGPGELDEWLTALVAPHRRPGARARSGVRRWPRPWRR